MERAVMPSIIKILSMDTDGTLWQTEEFFQLAQDRVADMLDSTHLQIGDIVFKYDVVICV